MAVEDVALLVELDSDPEVMRFLTGGRPSTSTEVEAIVDDCLAAPGWHRWVAFTGAEDDRPASFVGWFSLRAGPEDADFELGYRLGRAHWGKGLATEGVRMVIDHGFDQLDAARIWGQTMTINQGSRKVMERCGMRFVRTFHLDWGEQIEGTELGDVEYELLRPEWQPARDAASEAGR